MKRKIIGFFIITLSMFFLGGCGQKTENKISSQKPFEVIEEKKTEISKVEISNETQSYKDDNFGFSFTYPKSLNFETQSPYPGGTIKEISFRIDGITESQLLNNDLSKSLMQNDLYCNLDETGGSALCSNKSIEKIKNLKGVNGYKISRDKTFYDDDGNENILRDFVYAFPLKTEIGVSTYKAIILTVKYPSEQNLEILEKIMNTVETN